MGAAAGRVPGRRVARHRDPRRRLGETVGAGFLHLARYEVALARWHWLDADGQTYRNLLLCAAPTPEHYLRLWKEVLRLRHGPGKPVWLVVRGDSYADGEPIPRETAPGDLVLAPALRRRVEADVLRFFDPEVSALYRSMRVPHRRGVLLHGPPGNGKTSLIRMVGASMPQVSCMLLRPAAGFDTDDLETVVSRWKQNAPAVLAIEDLDWLLGTVNVSTFLNLIDGVGAGGDPGASAGGLLLIATTNNPHKLDPAVNNRPGRFDVVMEIACPDRTLRAEFLARELAGTPGFDERVLAKLTDATSGLSFAHLQEVMRLSGLAVIHEGRTVREPRDVSDAVETIRASHQEAARGFPEKFEMPFGLGHLSRRERAADNPDNG